MSIIVRSVSESERRTIEANNQVLDEGKEVDESRGIEYSGVGIHLGSTYSSVAVFKHPPPVFGCWTRRERRFKCSRYFMSDIMETVKNERGNSTTPSCVAFTDSGGVLIGEPAKDEAILNPTRSIFGIHHLLGKRFDDPDVQDHIKSLPYKVVNKDNQPHIEMEFKDGETKVFSPEEICALFLGKMKEIAEAHMGTEIKHAVVIVHQGHYNDELKRHILEAGKIAGLNVEQVGGSLLAVHLAARFGSEKHFRTVIYNLGGTAFHVSLIDMEDEDCPKHPLYSASRREDLHLGGQTFDNRLVDYFVNLIKRKYNKDISTDLTALRKLRVECERAKISLSSSDRVIVKIECSDNDDDDDDGIVVFEEDLTRETFQEQNMDLFNKTIDLARSILDEGGFDPKTDIDAIVLVGGNTQIPKIQHMLKELFGREALKDGNPDEALAFTATHIAGRIAAKDDGRFAICVPNSMSVGFELLGGVMATYVTSAETLPAKHYGLVTTCYDDQTTVEIKVFEGERRLTKYCHHLATLQIPDLPPAPRGELMIKIAVEVDIYWNICVTAEHEASQKIKSITIPAEHRYNTVEEITQAFDKYYGFHKEDKAEEQKVQEALRLLQTPPLYSTKFAVQRPLLEKSTFWR